LNRFHRGNAAYILLYTNKGCNDQHSQATTSSVSGLKLILKNHTFHILITLEIYGLEVILYDYNMPNSHLQYFYMLSINKFTYHFVRNINQSDDSSILLEFYRWLCHSKTLMAYFRAKFQVYRSVLTSRVKQLWKIMSRRKDKSICFAMAQSTVKLQEYRAVIWLVNISHEMVSEFIYW
jgi:hypothetical protein